MKRYKIYRGLLKTVRLTDEEMALLVPLSRYAADNNYSASNIYYGISQGYIVAKKLSGRWWILPDKNEKRRRFS